VIQWLKREEEVMSEETGHQWLTRRQALRGAGAGALAAYGSTFLAACGSSSNDSGGSATGATGAGALSAGPPGGGTPVRGGQLRIGLASAGNAETVTVPLAVALPDIVRVQNLFDPLFFVGDYGAVKPGLCTEAHPNKDATVWTFLLRHGVEWHDGKPFTANDVVYTIRSSWGSAKNTFNSVLAEFIDFNGVRALDPYTVQVPLKRAIAQFPSTTCIQQTMVVQDGTTSYNPPIGTGPFKFESFTPGKRSVFSANKNYWLQGRPYVDELVVDTSFADSNTTMSALLSGAVDIVPGVPPALAHANASSGQIYLGNQTGPGWMAPNFRVDMKPFQDLRVRKALKLIPNRPQAVTDVFSGYATAGNDCPGATLQYWASDLHTAYDQEQARHLLKQAGQENLTLTLQTSPVLPGMVEMATFYAAQAAAAGLKVNVENQATSNYYTPTDGYLTRPFSMDAFTNGVNSLPMFYLNSLLPGAPFSDTHWGTGDPSANNLLAEAVAELDPAKVQEKWHAVQELQFEQGGILILCNYNWLDGYGRTVRGVKTTNAGLCDNFIFSGAWFAKA
jgi:peptide/nickel transport system substrate-binding protein